MSKVTFDVSEFRLAFPAFPDSPAYTAETLQSYFDAACLYVSPENYGWLIGEGRKRAVYLMTAHLASISQMIASGKAPQMVSQSTVDRVSVTLVPPPAPDQWRWWMSLTPYGAQLLALLQANSVGGFYVGGLPESAAFHRVGGIVR